MSTIILGIESSCDDTSAAVIKDGYLLSNVVASQAVHESYGGVVPELASRAHQQNIVPVVHEALKRAGVTKEELSAVAFTRGPGLMGSLLVGVSFAKGFARSLGIPMIDVNHLTGHVLAHFIKAEGEEFDPNFHEAVMQTPTDEKPENTIIAELQKGYKLGDKVLRPTLVNVATAP